MAPWEHQLPPLADLARTTALELVFGQAWEGRGFPEPLNLQLLNLARLIDKAVGEYEAARAAFAAHDSCS